MFRERAHSGKPEELPDWVRRELAQARPPDRSVLEQYDYLVQDLAETFRDAARQAPAPESGWRGIAARFSLKGDFLAAFESQSAAGLQLAFASRGGGGPCFRAAKGGSPGKTLPLTLARVTVTRGEFCIMLETVRHPGGTQLEVNLIDHEALEVRPLSVRLTDESGSETEPRQNAQPGDPAPAFQLPRPGRYRIAVSWEQREEQVAVEFTEDAAPEK